MNPELAPFLNPRFGIGRGILAQVVFWSWNAVFLAVAAFGITPLVTFGLMAEALGDWRSTSLIAAALLVVAVPLATTLVGAFVLRRDPARLFRLFYAVEAPLFLLALARLFLLRELTTATTYVLVVATLGISAHVYRLLRNAEETVNGRVLLSLIGDTIGVGAATYTAVVLAFFAIPLGWTSLVTVARLTWLSELVSILSRQPAAALLMLLGGALILFSGTLFGLLPPALVALYVRRFRTSLRWSAARIGKVPTFAAVAVTSAVLVGGFFVSIRQPQREVLATLATPPSTDAERIARVARAETIRDGLVNTYLARFRYLGSTQDAHYVQDLWRSELGASRTVRDVVQAAFNHVAAPILFDGDTRYDRTESAGEAYKLFFNRSIQRGDRARVVAAVEATYSDQEREAGLIAEGQQKVLVTQQEAHIVDARDDLAEIEIHEVYQNLTSDPQEVLYSFSLPETAAVTGLWLGETDDRGQAFAFTVSPRGAAQRVYKAQVQRRRDPALLEQVGPRQYRLRAFPIPARTLTPDSRRRGIPTAVEGHPMHLWLRYRAFADGATFPLPQLLEARNAYRDRTTKRVVEGRPMWLDPEVWLPANIAPATPPRPSAHTARVDADTVITATPAPAPSARPTGRRFALVVDRSYSMLAHRAERMTAIDRVRTALATDNEVHVFLTSSPARGEAPSRLDDLRAFQASSIVDYGGQDPAELLEQLDALRADTTYDGILVLTDEGGFDLAGVKRQPKDLGAPVWMVHLGGKLAPGYDDATLETLQRRGGGAVTTVDEALARLGAIDVAEGDLGWADGYRFRRERDAAGTPESADATWFAAIAARRNIPTAARAPGLAGLDAIHAIAQRQGVVTPYSSMIVLVDDAQRRALQEAESSDNRFERAVETGQSTLDAPPPALGSVTGTPEPEEWVLLMTAAGSLAGLARARKRAATPVTSSTRVGL